MAAANEVGYKPPPEFREDVKDPLIELTSTDSTELWLIQWPINQPPDFGGQELTLKLHHDGKLGALEGSSGKSYDVVSFAAQNPDATVFLSSASESKIVGKISRRVSLVHYPEPGELQKHVKHNLKQMYQKSSATSLTTPTQGLRPRNLQSASGNAASTHSSRRRSSLSEVGEPSKPPKRRHVDEPTMSMDQSAQDSGRHHSAVTSSGSLEHSNERKSKKTKKNEG
uniref:Mediator-associated protein 2 n=1 Tax=Davidia involucrata TaxID=16924 RepID=A0A5B7A9G3_DAVIN